MNLMICLALTLLSSGCASKQLIITAITDDNSGDIYHGSKEGDVCFSKFYLDNVIQTKIEAKKK